MARNDFRPRSLAQQFDPPTGFKGGFGWVCGYSADSAFLNDAAERFTGLIEKRRAHAGEIRLALMLDPGNPQISCTDVPGILHLPFMANRKPFNLMHAKVAVLGFQSIEEPNEWLIRLIVSTGNWTQQTLERSLDLSWSIELSSKELEQNPTDNAKQRCSDIVSAWTFMQWLRNLFDDRLISASRPKNNNRAEVVSEWVNRLLAMKNLPPSGFFDNRSQSLLTQLAPLIKARGNGSARNYLALGSGFYEPPSEIVLAPLVLVKVVEQLRAERLLSGSADINVFVNPASCQSMASSVEAIRDQGWAVRAANKPAYFGKADRSLHAKFIFGASFRNNSNSCSSAWVYLGSGNLTSAGFLKKMSQGVGNLEAGVVFSPPDLLWEQTREASPGAVVTNILPIHWDSELETSLGLQAGSDMPDRPDDFVAGPVAYFEWQSAEETEHGGWLISTEAIGQELQVLDRAENRLPLAEGRVRWLDSQPREVSLVWIRNAEEQYAKVPVLDQFGRVAGTQLAALSIDEAWLHLESFPMPPEDEDLPPDDAPDGDSLPDAMHSPRGRAAEYPLRRMMQLVENIAEKQTAISKADWSVWCTRLEQTLTMAVNSDVLSQFRALKLNPLSPLWAVPFRPEYADSVTSAEGRLYEQVLARLETAWQVRDFSRFGGENNAPVQRLEGCF